MLPVIVRHFARADVDRWITVDFRMPKSYHEESVKSNFFVGDTKAEGGYITSIVSMNEDAKGWDEHYSIRDYLCGCLHFSYQRYLCR